MESISIREFARRLQVSHTAVRKAITSGRIEAIDDDGKLLWPAARDQFENNRLREDEFAGGAEDDGETAAEDLRHWKSQKEKWMAQRHELAARKQAGELCDAREVAQIGFNLGNQFRNFLYTIPPRAAPLLVDKTQREAYDILMDFVHEGLVELQRNILPENMRPEEDAEDEVAGE